MFETTARCYDGRSSEQQDVNILIDKEKLCVVNTLTGEKNNISLNTISSIERYNDEFRIELKSIDASIPSALFFFKNERFFQEIHSKWNQRNNLILFFINFFSTVPIYKRIAITSVATCICIVLFYIALTNFYRLIPVKYDQYLGKKIDKQLEQFFDISNSDKMDAFIHKAKITLSDTEDIFDYKIKIIHSPIVNAIALPGGYIYLFSGLIKNSKNPEEVLGIIAHEMGHVQKRHGIQQLVRNIGMAFITTIIIGITVEGVEIFENIELISEITSFLVLLKYSRSFEAEADQIAAKKLDQKKISVQGIIDFFSRLSKDEDLIHPNKKSHKKSNNTSEEKESFFTIPDYLSTHPSNKNRIHFFMDMKRKQQSAPSKLFDYEKRNWNLIKDSLPETE